MTDNVGGARVLLCGTRQRLVQLEPALVGEDVEVVRAESDAEAYRQLGKGIPDLVVADVTPATATARESLLVGLLACPGRTPFVAVVPDGRLAARFLRRGAAAVLREPIDPDEARLVLRRARAQHRRDLERAMLLADLDAMRSFAHDALLNVMDGVLVIDPGSQVLFANAEAARILLQDREKLIGSRLDPRLGWSLFKLLKQARDAPEKRAAEESDMVSGDERWKLLARAAIVHDHLGRAVGGVLVLRAKDPNAGVAGVVAAQAAQGAPVGATPAPAPRPSQPTPQPAPRPSQPTPQPAPRPAPPPAAERLPIEDAAKRTAAFMIGDILAALKRKTEEPPK